MCCVAVEYFMVVALWLGIIVCKYSEVETLALKVDSSAFLNYYVDIKKKFIESNRD